MTYKGNEKLIERKNALEAKCKAQFQSKTINQELCFISSDGQVFHIDKISEWNAIVAEYADTYDDALHARMEDGDLLYLDDMTEDEMLTAILAELDRE